MDKVFVVVTSGKTLPKNRHDDDFADRLNSRYSPMILIVFALVVTIQQVVRNPITCWSPVHFTENHQKYANSFCWMKNTYFLPYQDEIPTEGEERQNLKFYQWIQFIFLAQAILFYAPTMVWRTFNSKAGVDADNILMGANQIPVIRDPDDRDKKVNFLASQIDRFLESRAPEDKGCHCDVKHVLSGVLCRCCGRRIGNYLVILYAFQKLLYIGNIIFQFIALTKILDNKFYMYGPHMVADPIADHEWDSSHIVSFPRVTMCDMNVRRLGNVHRYTLQCVLPLNLYIEKMYAFLWFWMVLVLFLTLCSLLLWSVRFISRKNRFYFIQRHLQDKHRIHNEDDIHEIHKFLDDYLRQDGAFLLRMIATNSNHISTGDIISALWDSWQVRQNDDTTPSTPEELEFDPLIPQKPPRPQHPIRYNNKDRDKGKDDPSRPKKTDLSRAPTLYIRGSDTLNSKRPESDSYPEVDSSPGKKHSIQHPDNSSDDSDDKPRKPTAPLAEDLGSQVSSDDSDNLPSAKDTPGEPRHPEGTRLRPIRPANTRPGQQTGGVYPRLPTAPQSGDGVEVTTV